jgi:small multidrug resistance family-3 protein
MILRSIALFLFAAVAEIGGAWLIWQGVREHRGLTWIGAGIIALGLYGFVATLQPDPNFGRILAAYGGVFVAGSLAWAVVLDGFKPDRYDVIGATICLIGVTVIMYAPRAWNSSRTGGSCSPTAGTATTSPSRSDPPPSRSPCTRSPQAPNCTSSTEDCPNG